MKKALYSLMITAAVVAFTLPAQAATVTSETTVIETGAAANPALLEAAKTRMTRDLQTALSQAGYDVNVNGSYDVKTANAVREYQKANNMPVTGEASADLLVAMGVDTNLGTTQIIEEREVMRYKLATKGSENANVYDDPNADRTGAPVFKQRYQKMTETERMGGVTTTETSTVYTSPVMNR